MTTDTPRERLELELPKLRNGFVLAGILFTLEMVWGALEAGLAGGRSAAGYAAALAVAATLVCTAYLLHCVSAYHHIVNKVEGWSHPISPKRAVRFHFIPVFNLYWNFKWPLEIAKFVNWRLQRSRMSGILAGALVLVGALVAGFIDGSLGMVVVLCAFSYVSRCLREAFAAQAVPPEMHAVPTRAS
jgi:hypothetical protein